MNRIKKTSYIVIILSILFMGKGIIYRSIVSYDNIGNRRDYKAIDAGFIVFIEEETKRKKKQDIESILKTAHTLTNKRLRFSTSKNDIDPNALFYSRTAHCVGYATFYTSICNYLFVQSDLAQDWTATTRIGQLYGFGINMHQYFKTSFFKDHDFVIIENKITGKQYYIDPTVSDYLGIDRVSCRIH